MNKKAMTGIGILISLVVILLIIVIAVGLMFNQSSLFNKNLNSCESNGGKCVSSCDGTVAGYKCEKGKEICCIKDLGVV